MPLSALYFPIKFCIYIKYSPNLHLWWNLCSGGRPGQRIFRSKRAKFTLWSCGRDRFGNLVKFADKGDSAPSQTLNWVASSLSSIAKPSISRSLGFLQTSKYFWRRQRKSRLRCTFEHKPQSKLQYLGLLPIYHFQHWTHLANIKIYHVHLGDEHYKIYLKGRVCSIMYVIWFCHFIHKCSVSIVFICCRLFLVQL